MQKKSRELPVRKKSLSHTIKRLSLPDTLAQSLRERILNGEFAEGDPLVQEALADEYEVSRMPIREALRQLEAMGLVKLKTHKGAVVTTLPTEQISELFDLRALLECSILESSLPQMNEGYADRSRALLGELETAYHDNDVAAWGSLNWQFHRSLYVPAQREQTLALIEGVNVQTDRYIRLQLSLTHAVADAENEHRELLRLCEARDLAAIPFLKGHILNAGKNLMKALGRDRDSRT